MRNILSIGLLLIISFNSYAWRIENKKLIIEEGDNLWNISHSLLAKGIDYKIIWDFNKEKFKQLTTNPSLIYDGMELDIPAFLMDTTFTERPAVSIPDSLSHKIKFDNHLVIEQAAHWTKFLEYLFKIILALIPILLPYLFKDKLGKKNKMLTWFIMFIVIMSFFLLFFTTFYNKPISSNIPIQNIDFSLKEPTELKNFYPINASDTILNKKDLIQFYQIESNAKNSFWDLPNASTITKWFLAGIFYLAFLLILFLFLKQYSKNRERKRLRKRQYNKKLYDNTVQLSIIISKYKKVSKERKKDWALDFYEEIKEAVMKDIEFPNSISHTLYFLGETLYNISKRKDIPDDDNYRFKYEEVLSEQLEETLNTIKDNLTKEQQLLLRNRLKDEADRF